MCSPLFFVLITICLRNQRAAIRIPRSAIPCLLPSARPPLLTSESYFGNLAAICDEMMLHENLLMPKLGQHRKFLNGECTNSFLISRTIF
jgi:hypothetical protein